MSAPCCVDCGRVCSCVYTRDGARLCSPCAGVGCLYCKAEAAARPTGVPLTADNVADALECMDIGGSLMRVWLVNAHGAWETAGNTLAIDPDIMALLAPAYGTVVTKWREP